MNIGIINYQMGNLGSVYNAFNALNSKVFIAEQPKELASADGIVLPGVGSFGKGMNNLESGGWIEALELEVRSKGKPFLGICLGMQLLATSGSEHGLWKGLNWVAGTVVRLNGDGPDFRLPHIGWNDVFFTKKEKLFARLDNAKDFYFVHSFAFYPEDITVASGICRYGEDFVAAIENDNIFAVQFHPEKSHKAGLALLDNFLLVCKG